jgi:hypothetical protein
MSTRVWLFPFTHGVDVRAIEQVIQLAASSDVELDAVALHTVAPDAAEQGVRLEDTMQANDFFEVVRRKAAQRHVPVRCEQICMQHMAQDINRLAEERRCSSIVVVLSGQKSLLLETSIVKELLLQSATPLMLVRPLTQPSRAGGPVSTLRSWLQRRQRRAQDIGVAAARPAPVQGTVAVADESFASQELSRPSEGVYID